MLKFVLTSLAIIIHTWIQNQTCFCEYFVPNCPAYLTHNINLNAHLANGTLVREHSLAFDSSNEKHLLDDLIKLTPFGDNIELQTPPTAINVEIFPTFQTIIIPHLNPKANKDMNGNMDLLQIMGKSSFLLSKKQLNITMNFYLPEEDHCISMHQWFQLVITFQLNLDFV